jgi:DNA-binding CsgD family transcriptional regulator
MDEARTPGLVGRARERAAIDDVLAGAGELMLVEGEPGIGKSRLLAYVAACAGRRGATVLEARAADSAGELPYALLTEALDGYLAALGERRLSRLGLPDPAALPALKARDAGPGTDRHRTHRALRDLLERLAASHPLVLCLDDLQWADPASVDALAALVRRPPAAPVLIVLSARQGQLRAPLDAALASALREQRLVHLPLAPLTASEAAELVGAAATAIYAQSGGNPFYLEQLARVHAATPPDAGRDPSARVPPAVAAALAGELSALDAEPRRLLEGAAVVGDPFELALATNVSELEETVALRALDALLAGALVRGTSVPRRFAFRHPLVRDAVYAALPGGWRLGAHARAAAALERYGAGPIERAHHVEHAAVPGDADAIAVLTSAAERLQGLAPASAARFFAATLRLLPDRPDLHVARTRTQAQLADAQAAAGDPLGARRTLLDALRTAASDERLPLTVALANQEWWLGGHEDARRRLQVVLGDLPAQPSPDRIRARLALALTALHARDLRGVVDHASDARDDARAIGDPVFEAAALAVGALASVAAAEGPDGDELLAESTAALERLTIPQLTTRLPALWMHARARRLLGRFPAALADLERAGALAAETGRERVQLFVTIESALTLIGLGRLGDARSAAEEGVERADLAGSPRMQLWAQSTLSVAHLAAGDVAAALERAGAAARIPTTPDFHAAGQPGWCLGVALTAAGNPERAVAAMLEAFGGPTLRAVLPADRPAAAADLVEAHLAQGDVESAEAALELGRRLATRSGSGWAIAVTGIAHSAILVARQRPADAVAAAAAAREAAGEAPLAHAHAQLAEGKALAAAGDRRHAVETLTAAETALHGYGALRRRNEAVRALRGLGHRVVRPTTASESGLTRRELDITELVVAGRTNREIAEQLVLSPRTVDAHLRNIYAKLGVRSRVELVRALDVASAAGGPATPSA